MDVTESDIAGIPGGNLRVPRDTFASVWRAAARMGEQRAAQGVTDWYVGAVAMTCQWLAAAPGRPVNGRRALAESPATRRSVVAYEELIEAEFLAAERLEERQPSLAASRPGWCEGVRATLRWAWRRQGPAPVEVQEHTAS